MKVDSMKVLEGVLDTYLEAAVAMGYEVSRDGEYNGDKALCLIGAVAAVSGAPRYSVTSELGLDHEQRVALETGFCGWTPISHHEEFNALGKRLANKHLGAK